MTSHDNSFNSRVNACDRPERFERVKKEFAGTINDMQAKFQVVRSILWKTDILCRGEATLLFTPLRLSTLMKRSKLMGLVLSLRSNVDDNSDKSRSCCRWTNVL